MMMAFFPLVMGLNDRVVLVHYNGHFIPILIFGMPMLLRVFLAKSQVACGCFHRHYLWPGRNFLRKGVEAWFALLIELTWPKRRILEVYLNVAEFGPGLYGVPAASRVYFGKPASEISDAEAALLAAVLPNPHRLDVARPSPYVRERQGWILRHMQRLRREGWLQAL
jgi:membrane carboxypeptidase/penicillin-binding protein